MSYVQNYKGYKWIKVKRFDEGEDGTYEDLYHKLLRHHQQETQFLIAEVRKLAEILDETVELASDRLKLLNDATRQNALLEDISEALRAHRRSGAAGTPVHEEDPGMS